MNSNINFYKKSIALLVSDHMGIDADQALADIPFKDLHPDFDSLALLELQLLLEKEFDMEFDGFDPNAQIPTNVSEMAQALMREHEAYKQRQAKKTASSKDKGNVSVSG